jgi:hypothetical protein
LVDEAIRGTPTNEGRANLECYFRWALSMARTNSTVEIFSESTASYWARLAAFNVLFKDNGERPMSDVERMVVATAIDRKLVLVEGYQPYHNQLSELNVVDPYAV